MKGGITMNRRILVFALFVLVSHISFAASQTVAVAGDIKDVNELTLSDIQPGPRFRWPGGGTSGAGRWIIKDGKFETPGAAYYEEDEAPAIFMGKLPDNRYETLQWSPNTTHVLIGRNILKGVSFDSDPDYPLTFRLIQGKGYVYMCGSGTVTLEDHTVLRLGKDDTSETWLPVLRSEDIFLAEAAAQALGYLTKTMESKDQVVPALITALDSRNFGVRWNSIEALGRIGDSRALTPFLALSESGGFLGRLVDESIGRIPGSKPYIEEQQLLDAAETGDLNTITRLLESGVNVNAKNQSGITSLHLALFKNHTDVAELLLNKGADVNARNEHGDTPLLWALYNDHTNIAELLLAKDADVNTKSKNGNTPLHLAMFKRNIKIAKLLLTKGANVNAKGEKGFNPLHVVVFFHGHTDMAELLLMKGADVNAKSIDGETPLDLAVSKGNTAMVELLHKYGAK